MVVNGATSDMLPVLSGVPQGSVLEPSLFLIYIDGVNNIGLSVGSNLVLYADDMLLYRPVSSPEDHLHLQADIDAIAHWVDINLLQFNVQKCKAMKITRKKQSASTPVLKLNCQILQRTDAYKYLGLLISHDLHGPILYVRSVARLRECSGCCIVGFINSYSFKSKIHDISKQKHS